MSAPYLCTFAMAFVTLSCPANAGADQSDASGRYRIDPQASHIGFTIDQIAGRGLSGAFERFSGTIQIEAGQISRSAVTIDVVPASVSTGQQRVDTFLRSNAVFDAEHEKQIFFRSTSVKQLDGSSALVVGQMTARGKTGMETFTARLDSQSRGKVIFQITGKVLRSRYGMDVGTPIYSNVVDFDMKLTANRQ